ncbi:DUF4269 domain-containing protein [Pedobacter aquatilis]|uniref:DUF4269 domain-containing protein n=1 Tax=Pedobacter aquatilis TaxID=351343 RepID=UPI0025B29DF5|nr:DUF4269 domain-containing protein [Pedobacter aquatilis]MDN3585157.1 DUF4269 domain-containing protein [Pedobacter aquatilis]
MINFLDISYLKSGNQRQQEAYHALVNNQVLEKLQSFSPILVGTIPINIDIESSDLDIICFVKDRNDFIETLARCFNKEKDFNLSENPTLNSIKANFFIDDFEFEIFGQNIPTQQQNAYRHMLIEYQLLLEKGESFRQQVIELKKQGFKTESAFAKLLGLGGNPYEELLKLELSGN